VSVQPPFPLGVDGVAGVVTGVLGVEFGVESVEGVGVVPGMDGVRSGSTRCRVQMT
jgi:hypothetical protein